MGMPPGKYVTSNASDDAGWWAYGGWMMSLTPVQTAKSKAPGPLSQVEMILAQVDSLPTLPAVATRLLQMTTRDQAGLREVVRMVETDQSLAVRILSAVNRADMGMRADNVERAVSLLGFNGIRSLILSVQIFESFIHRQEPGVSGFDQRGFWKHSLAVACAARLLASINQPARGPAAGQDAIAGEEAFLCGLVHDIGKVVLAALFPKTYDRVVTAAEAVRGCIRDVERDVFGVDHVTVGRRLAAHWKLPVMIDECIWLHHHLPASTPSRVKHTNHIRAVQFADRLARLMCIGYSGNHECEYTLAEAAGEMGLDQAAVDRVMAELPDLIEARAELLGLDKVTSKDVYQEALSEANRELARINSTLSAANGRLELRSSCLEALRKLNSLLGTAPTHEDICRAGLQAAALLTPARPLALLAWSPHRSVVFVTELDAQDETVRIRALLEADSGAPAELRDQDCTWWPVSLLPKSLLDSAAGIIRAAPAWYRPIRHHDQFWGVFVVSGNVPVELNDSFAALSDSLGAWLNGAESSTEALRLNEELAEMNRRLVATQGEMARLRSLLMVGEMAAGAAHELNNPLAIISGRAQLLMSDLHGGEVQRSVSLIAEQARRASDMVSDLMEFAKPLPPQPSTWSAGKLLREIRDGWLEKGLLNPEQFELRLSDDMPEVRADAGQMRRLFDELIRNAIEAMQGSQQPKLSINYRGRLADDRIVIEVQDNGCGMTPEVLEKAATPFYSHRTAGRGRGMGLSRAVRYAEINGGRIRLTSRVNEGTVARVELPLAEGD